MPHPSYNEYLIFRNYDQSASKLVILKRALIDSWAEPGFHRFWQVWNPGIGYLLYRLYRAIGGNRHRLMATMLVFMLCGFAHDVIVMLIFRRPFMAFTAAFTFFGLLALVNRSLERVLNQNKWSGWLNVITNLACLWVSIYTAVQIQMLIFP